MSSDKRILTRTFYNETEAEGFLNVSARYISNIFSPPLCVVYGVLLATPFLDIPLKWGWALFFISLFVLPPTLYVYILMKRGVITDFHINIRKQRFKPMLLMFTNTVFGIVAYSRLGGPNYLIILAICCLVLLGVILLLTLFSKISGHSAAAGGLLTVSLSVFSMSIVPFILAIIIPFIAWSRVRLGRHSVAQTFTGFLLGVTTFGTILYFSNLL